MPFPHTWVDDPTGANPNSQLTAAKLTDIENEIQTKADIGSGGGGTGDVSSDTTTSVDSQVALFSSTTGKIIKRATASGMAKLTSGVLSAGVAGTDYVAPSITITGSTSLAGGGNLSANRTLTLSGDSASPGNSKYYGTNLSGVKGYHSLPTGGGGTAGATVVTPEDYGAAGNGSSNDTTALNAAFADLGPDKTLLIADGKTYAHAGVLQITADGTRVFGTGTLAATAQNTSALQILSATDVAIEGITLTCSATSRGNTGDHHKIFVENSSMVRIRDVRIVGSKAAGILVAESERVVLDHCRVQNTYADGIHFTVGSSECLIIGCECVNVGDDGFACVSYGADPAAVSNITFIGCCLEGQVAGGRGMTVVGGNNIRFYDMKIVNSYAAGIYIACEPSFTSYGVADVIVSGVTLIGSNHGFADANHGAILVYNGRTASFLVQNVRISNVNIINTNTGANQHVAMIMDVGGADNIRNIVFRDINITGTGPSQKFGNSGVPTARYSLDPELNDALQILHLNAGAVSDGQFDVAPTSGAIGLDTTNNRLYVRVGSTWRYATLT